MSVSPGSSSPQLMSSLCLARPLKKRELPAISVVTTAVFRGAKRRHSLLIKCSRLADKNIKAIYIDPGSPWLPSEATPQRAIASITNGFIESFHNRLRDECLNREVLLRVAESQVVIEQWRHTYNNEHPHSRLGFKSPQEFVRFLSDLGCVRATPSLRQNLSYTSILKPLTSDLSP